MEVSDFLQTVEALHVDARRRGLFFQTCEDEQIRGRRIHIAGRELLSFGSCSYLGLEYHPDIIRVVHEAVDRFGTQFASSRGYLSSPWYLEFEELLTKIFGAPTIALQTTTLAHQGAFDVLLTEKDAIVMDHHVHYSVQRAATLARAGGARVELVRHDELERAIDIVRELSRKYRTVWFSTDGVTSMYGDLAPVELLQQILDVAPNVRLYIDDAHGMSWAGEHGRGSFLSRMPLTERIVVATSLAKAFGAGGAALVFSSREECERVRMCGGAMVFSGPLQPPLLGAALGSARVHLTPEIAQRQAVLRDRVEYCNELMIERGLPLMVRNESPVKFVRCGLPRVANEVAERMTRDGIYVNVSMYPAVPMKRGGVRLGITVDHTHEDIERAVEALARHVPAVLAEEGMSREELDLLFAGSVKSARRSAYVSLVIDQQGLGAPARRSVATPTTGVECDPATLDVQRARTIREIDRAAWDRALGGVGCISWDALELAERIFRGQPKREHNWDFHYVVVRDRAGVVVGATVFTTALQKDDVLMREEVSREVERRRLTDPYLLTSRMVTLGTGLSEGNHLFVDRAGPWRAALTRILEAGNQIYESEKSDLFVLRDLPGDDPEMDDFILEQGLVKVPNLDSHVLHLDWKGEERFVNGLSRHWRREVQQIMAASEGFSVATYGVGNRPLTPVLAEQLHALYLNIARKKLRFNAFEFPPTLIEQLASSPAWELGVLHLDPALGGPPDGAPIAFWAAHRHGEDYAPLFCGLDYAYVRSHGAYRQMSFQMLKLVGPRGVRRVHMGMDAEIEKRRFGARTQKTCLYVQARGDYNAAILREIVAEVGLSSGGEA